MKTAQEIFDQLNSIDENVRIDAKKHLRSTRASWKPSVLLPMSQAWVVATYY